MQTNPHSLRDLSKPLARPLNASNISKRRILEQQVKSRLGTRPAQLTLATLETQGEQGIGNFVVSRLCGSLCVAAGGASIPNRRECIPVFKIIVANCLVYTSNVS